jgi:hypothetical protein
MVEKLKESHKSQNIVDVEKYTTELTDVWNKISTKLYQNTSENQNTQADPSDTETTDIDFEEVK